MKAPSLSRKPAPPVGQINGTDRPVGPPMPVQKLRQPGRSKRPLMLALMVLLMVVSALAAWFFVQKSTERVAVVGVAHDVAWGQEIQASDLVAVEVVPDPCAQTGDLGSAVHVGGAARGHGPADRHAADGQVGDRRADTPAWAERWSGCR